MGWERDDMLVKEVMSKELIVGYVPGTVEEALRILAENNVSGMPVLKKGTKKVVGVVTRTDIFKNPEEDQLAMVMNENYYSIREDEDITKAAELFYQHRIHGLPVLDEEDNLVGIISPSDLLKVIVDRKIDDIAANHFTTLVVPIYVETPLPIVMEIINITNENALPILDDNLKLAGIVTDGDLFKHSQIKEQLLKSDMGLGADEDQWTWEGIRDTIRMYYATSKISLPKIPVREVMVTDVKTATRHTPVVEIAKTMMKHNISHIPVVDAESKLIGMITDIDLMHCLIQGC
ncbi:MAG TPA: CBS domain-containing protein [Thermoplasmatales archaeon]|nr:CBS domain-containing protein [Thermoplasmatales archaeon]